MQWPKLAESVGLAATPGADDADKAKKKPRRVHMQSAGRLPWTNGHAAVRGNKTQNVRMSSSQVPRSECQMPSQSPTSSDETQSDAATMLPRYALG